MDIDLESFIRTGRIGDIALGVTKNSILQLLGPPDDAIGGRAAPEILRHGDVEIMVKDGRATFISITAPNARNSDTAYAGWQPTVDTTLLECQEFLRTNQIVAQPEHRTTRGSFKTLVVGASGVRLAFSDDRLDKLYVTNEGAAPCG
jgi:hypothetical protein